MKRSGETAGTEPERNDRRRAADGSKRDCVLYSPSATGARYAAAERALVVAVTIGFLELLNAIEPTEKLVLGSQVDDSEKYVDDSLTIKARPVDVSSEHSVLIGLLLWAVQYPQRPVF